MLRLKLRLSTCLGEHVQAGVRMLARARMCLCVCVCVCLRGIKRACLHTPVRVIISRKTCAGSDTSKLKHKKYIDRLAAVFRKKLVINRILINDTRTPTVAESITRFAKMATITFLL